MAFMDYVRQEMCGTEVLELTEEDMKEVDIDIIVPEYEPQAEALEAETAEDKAETAAEEVQAAESLSENEAIIARPILKEIKDRLTFLNNVGLNYLTLSRSAGTLSGGESQRIRLATQIGSNLSGVHRW